jgi:hypothetical protein
LGAIADSAWLFLKCFDDPDKSGIYSGDLLLQTINRRL